MVRSNIFKLSLFIVDSYYFFMTEYTRCTILILLLFYSVNTIDTFYSFILNFSASEFQEI